MSQIINAVFEGGVFKPVQNIRLREHENVLIKIIFPDEWEKRFDSTINRIHQTSVQYSPDEIENDILQEIHELRKENQSSY